MTGYNLNEGKDVVLSASGAGTVQLAPGSYERWHITRIGVFTNDAATATVVPRCDVYLTSVGSVNWVGGTLSGNLDASDEDLWLEKNQPIIAVFSGGNAGSTATLSVFGTRENY